MSTKLRFLSTYQFQTMLTSLAVFTAMGVFLVGCSTSNDEIALKSLKAKELEGSYHKLFSESKTVLDNQSDYDSATIAKAQDYYDTSRKVLTKHYQSSVSALAGGGNYAKAVLAYESSDEEIRKGLELNFPLQEQIMRSAVEVRNIQLAQQALEVMNNLATSTDQKNHVASLKQKLETLISSSDTVKEYKLQIIDASKQYGFTLGNDGAPATMCTGTSQEDQIPPHILELINQFDLANSEYNSLKEELGKPGRIRVKDVLAASSGSVPTSSN